MTDLATAIHPMPVAPIADYPPAATESSTPIAEKRAIRGPQIPILIPTAVEVRAGFPAAETTSWIPMRNVMMGM